MSEHKVTMDDAKVARVYREELGLTDSVELLARALAFHRGLTEASTVAAIVKLGENYDEIWAFLEAIKAGLWKRGKEPSDG